MHVLFLFGCPALPIGNGQAGSSAEFPNRFSEMIVSLGQLLRGPAEFGKRYRMELLQNDKGVLNSLRVARDGFEQVTHRLRFGPACAGEQCL